MRAISISSWDHLAGNENRCQTDHGWVGGRGAAYPGGMVRLLAPSPGRDCDLGGTATAWAHTEITSSQPADGATLRKAPAAVVLTFSEAPLDTGLAVVATGPQGGRFDATVAGGEVVAPWPRDLPAGGYRVAYRVVADDGHPIEGRSPSPSRGRRPRRRPHRHPLPPPPLRSRTSHPPGSRPGCGSWPASCARRRMAPALAPRPPGPLMGRRLFPLLMAAALAAALTACGRTATCWNRPTDAVGVTVIAPDERQPALPSQASCWAEAAWIWPRNRRAGRW